jgi:hypothetical protein
LLVSGHSSLAAGLLKLDTRDFAAQGAGFKDQGKALDPASTKVGSATVPTITINRNRKPDPGFLDNQTAIRYLNPVVHGR